MNPTPNHHRLSLAAALALAACVALTLPGEIWGQQRVGRGPAQRIDALAVGPAQPGTLLKFAGVLDPTRFPSVLVVPIDGHMAYSIEIPGAQFAPTLQTEWVFDKADPLYRVDLAQVKSEDDPSQAAAIVVVRVAAGAVVRFLPGQSSNIELNFHILNAADAAATAPLGSEMADAEDAGPTYQGRPIHVRVAVLNGSGVTGKASEMGILLGDIRRRSLERKLGQRLELVNVSNFGANNLMETLVYYRPGFLRAALLIARAIPGQQSVRTMVPDQIRKIGIDVEIVLGGRGM